MNNLPQPGEGLYQRTVRGGAWVFGLRITEQVFNIVRLIILARVLAPNDFGLLGIALLGMMALETFSQTGFQQALIQKKENIKDYLDAAWTVMLLRSLILCAVLFFAAPHIALFFDAPQATTIIQVIGISFLLGGAGGVGGFVNIGVLYFQKELKFNKHFIYRASGTLADFVVAVSAALILKSVWALVFGLLAGNLVRLIVSYLVHPYRPRLSSDLGKAKELFGFGKWILGSSVLIFLLTLGDDIFVGKLLGVALLGFYQMAYRTSNAPATQITHVISQVTFPAYSKLQDNLPSLREAYLKTLQFTAFISIPLAAGIFILAPEFTQIFLTEKWMPMVPAMQALCIFGVTRSIGATLGPIFYAVGKPEIQTRFSTIQLIILAIIIYPLTIRWSILGTSVAVVIPNIISVALCTKAARNIMKIKFQDFFRPIFIPITAAFIMCLFIFLARHFLLFGGSILSVLILALLGGITYFGSMYLCDRATEYKMRDMIGQVFNNLRAVKHD